MRSRTLIFSVVSVIGFAGCLYHSPGTRYKSSSEPLNDRQVALRDQLRRDVYHLADEIGSRNGGRNLRAVLAAERWIVGRLEAEDISSRRDKIDLGAVSVGNVEVTFQGSKRPDEILVIGGHYDTVSGSPGANDNASGVALLLAAATHLKAHPPERTVRVVFFVNEEAPFSFGIQMGSKVYAAGCKARSDRIVAMISVDSVGRYSNERGSQDWPPIAGWFLPSKGDFIAFGSDRTNRPLLDLVVRVFQEQSRFPSIGAATDSKMAARGDHAPFWWEGYPAIAMSDTSEFRDPDYHRPTDRPGNLNYEEMARMAEGFLKTIDVLGSVETVLPAER